MTRRELLRRLSVSLALGGVVLAGCKKAGQEPEEDTDMTGGEPNTAAGGEGAPTAPPPPGPGGQPAPAQQSNEFSGDVH